MIKFKPILHHTPQNAGSSRHCSGSSPFDTLQELHPTDQFSSQVNRLTCFPLYPNQSNSGVLWHYYSWLQFHNLVSSYQIEILSNISVQIAINSNNTCYGALIEPTYPRKSRVVRPPVWVGRCYKSSLTITTHITSNSSSKLLEIRNRSYHLSSSVFNLLHLIFCKQNVRIQ